MKKINIKLLLFALTYFLISSLTPAAPYQYRWLEETSKVPVIDWLKNQEEKTNLYLDQLSGSNFIQSAINHAYSKDVFLQISKFNKKQNIAVQRIKGGTQNIIGLYENNILIRSLLKTKDLPKNHYFSSFISSPFKKNIIIPVYANGSSDLVTLYLINIKTGQILQRIPDAMAYSSSIQWIDQNQITFLRNVSNHYLHLIYKIDTNEYLLPKKSDTALNTKTRKYLLKEINDNGHKTSYIRSIFNKHWKKLPFSLGQWSFTEETDNALYFENKKEALKLIRLSIEMNQDDIFTIGQKKEFSLIKKGAIRKIFHSRGITAIATIFGKIKELHILNKEGDLFFKTRLPNAGTFNGLTFNQKKNSLFLDFRSPIHAKKTIKINLSKKELNLSKLTTELMTDIDGTRYVTKIIESKSNDGTLVPMRVVHLASLTLNHQNPLFVQAYGGHNIIARFLAGHDSQIKLFLQSGGVHATPAPRGGGELGTEWARAARLFTKFKTYEDVESSIELLHQLGYSNPRRTGLMGWSSGGLLAGAVMTRRPELLKLSIPGNGLQDLLRKEIFDLRFGKGWSHEYGGHQNAEELLLLESYSPLIHAQKKRDYPTTFIMNGRDDSRVNPIHSFKFTHALQDHQATRNPILLYSLKGSGHWPTSVSYQGASGKKALIALWKTIFNELDVPMTLAQKKINFSQLPESFGAEDQFDLLP